MPERRNGVVVEEPDARLAVAVGRLVMTAGQIEFVALLQIRQLLAPNFDLTEAITASMSFFQAVELLGRLDADRPDRSAWITDARSFMKERNQVIHSAWLHLSDGSQRGISRWKGVDRDADSINQLADHGLVLAGRGYDLALSPLLGDLPDAARPATAQPDGDIQP